MLYILNDSTGLMSSSSFNQSHLRLPQYHWNEIATSLAAARLQNQ